MGEPPSPIDSRSASAPGGDAPSVSVIDDRPDGAVDPDRWRRLAVGVLRDEGITASAEMNVLFVDETVIGDLNQRFMGEVGPTDVLAFPIDTEDDDPIGSALAGPEGAGPPRLLGDVVICPAVAARNAAERGVGVDDETALLLVHGILHLLGHDHREPEETERMRHRERQLLARHHRGDR